VVLIVGEDAAKRNSRMAFKSARGQVRKMFDISRRGGLFSIDD